MLISVIIPTYNEAKYIGRCLASLQKQKLETNDEMEIIVVDDGSKDASVKRIKQFPEVKLLHQAHQGPAIARNQGAKMARGEILVLVDADMEFDEDFIKHLIQPIKQKAVKGTFSKEEFVANWDNVWARCWNWNLNLAPKRRLPLNYPDKGEDFRAILKSEFQRVNGYDHVGYNDTWTLVKKLGYKPIHAPGAVFYHHNPARLSGVFQQAKWVGKREYKLKFVGKLVALARASFPVSLVIGLYKSVKYREPLFFIFKLIFDLGISLGIMEMIMLGNKAK